MKNKLSDLNNHLFAQLERLSEEDITDEKLHAEIQRSKAISTIAGDIIEGMKTVVDAYKLADKMGFKVEGEDNIKKLL